MLRRGTNRYLFMLILLLLMLTGCGARTSDKMMATTEAAEEAMYSYSEDIYTSELAAEEAAALAAEETGVPIVIPTAELHFVYF